MTFVYGSNTSQRRRPRSVRLAALRFAVVGVGAAALVHCGGNNRLAVGVTQEPWNTRPKEHTEQAIAALAAAKPAVDTRHALMTERQGSVGPFLATRGESAMLAGLRLDGDGGADLVGMVLLDGMRAGSPMRTVAHLAGLPEHLILRPHTERPGAFLATYTVSSEQGESLQTARIDSAEIGADKAGAVAKHAPIMSTANRIVWMESFPTSGGSLVFYAEDVPGNDAHLFAIAVDDAGVVAGTRARIAVGALGWQARQGKDGVGIAWAQATDKGPQVQFQRLTSGGELQGASFALHATGPSAKTGASGTVDMAYGSRGYVVAWTDDSKRTPSVSYVVVPDTAGPNNGKPSDPVRAAESSLGAELLGVATSGNQTAIAWEVPSDQANDSRFVHTALIGAKGLEPARYSFGTGSGGTPTLVGATTGFAWLTGSGDRGADRGTTGVDKRLVRLDERLAPISNRPILTANGFPVHLAWNLDCAANPCRLLYAEGEHEVTVFGAEMRDDAASSPATMNAAPPAALPAPKPAPKPAPNPILGAATPVVKPAPVAAPKPLGSLQPAATTTATTATAAAAPASTVAAPGVQAIATPPQAQPLAVTPTSEAHAQGPRTEGPESRLPIVVRAPIDDETIESGAAIALPAGARVVLADEQIAALAVTKQASTHYLASLSATPDLPNAARGSRHATLTVTRIGEDGTLLGTGFVVSTRARTRGGVAIAAAPDAREPIALAWVAREEGDPQVHLTKLDRAGQRLSDQLLTQIAGDARDVAITPISGGFLVVWVDGRDGNGEVYAARVDHDLKRVTRDERITTARGDAYDLSIFSAGEAVYASYIDTRDSTDGAVYVAKISAKNAARVGEELRVASNAARTLKPQLFGDGAQLSVVYDEPSVGARGAANRAWKLSQIDARTWTQTATQNLPLGAGNDGLALTRDAFREGGIFGLFGGPVAANARAMKLGFLRATSTTPEVLANFTQPALNRMALAASGGMLFFADRSGNGRVLSVTTTPP